MTITQEQFFSVLSPLTVTGKDSSFRDMTSFLDQEKGEIKYRYVGATLFESIESKGEKTRKAILNAICLGAFLRAIPFIDLVLTATGFGIVSNSNVVPASKERVESLRNQTNLLYQESLDKMILTLFREELNEWKTEPPFIWLTSSFFWTAEDLRQYTGMPTANREDLVSLAPKIRSAEDHIAFKISAEYSFHLIDLLRAGNPPEDDKKVILMIRQAIGFYLAGERRSYTHRIDDIMNLIDGDSDLYPLYRDSQAYKIKHFQHYENKKCDTTFFWG